MAEVLSSEQVAEKLRGLAEWHAMGDSITRSAKLAGFEQAIEAVNRIAEVAQSKNHHPDIDIRFNTLTFHCSTHSEGGVTEADLSMAAEINRVLDSVRA